MSRPFRIRWRPVPALAVSAALLLAAPVAAGPVAADPATRQTRTPATTAAPAPLPPPKAWIVVDGDTGNVVDAGNDRTPMPPASLTKVITALAVGQMPPDTPVPVSAVAAAQPADKLFMKAGSVWTEDEMIHSLLLSSANDAAVALAEKVGGTVAGFQQIFARTALGLGMADNPVLRDPAGLDGPDGVDGGNLVSARDLAIAGRALLADPALAQIVATPVYYFDGPDAVHHRLTNHNKPFLTTYAGAQGMKTGYTKRAGACLIAVARQSGRTMLAVILAGANPTQQAKELLDKGFATPAAAETTTDQLPPVVTGAASAAAAASPASAAAAATAPSTGAAPAPVKAAASSAMRSPLLSWRQAEAAAATALLLMILITLGAHRRRRRRRRIFAHLPRSSRAPARDRRAA